MKKIFRYIVPFLLVLMSLVAFVGCNPTEPFKVTFMSDDLVHHIMEITGEEVPAMPSDPTKDGYVFDGWYLGGNTEITRESLSDFLGDSNITEITVYARWKAVSVGPWTVTFDPDGGERVSGGELTQTINNGSSATAPVLEKEGYTYTWDKEFSSITADITVKAIWTIKTYAVTFDPDGGERVSGGELTQIINNGSSATAPVLSRVGYTYTWDKEFSSITADITVKAIWTINTYTVTFEPDGGERASGGELTQTVDHGSNATAPVLEKEGYNLSWNKSFKNVTSALVITAEWTIKTYTVIFDPDGGERVSGGELTQIVEHGSSATAPVLEKEGHSFINWDFSFEEITQNMTITASWEANLYEVTFDPNGGNLQSGDLEQEVYYGEAAIPPALAREGFSYTWDNDYSNITASITITAVWEELPAAQTFNVTFIVDAEYHISGELEQTVEEGKSAVPPVCYREGFILSWEPDYHNVTQDLEINAIWEGKNIDAPTCTVYFDGGDGNYVSGELTQEVEPGGSAIPPIFTKAGFTLSWEGDYTEVYEDTEITAVWIEKEPETWTVVFVCEEGQYASGEITQEVKDGQNAYPPCYIREGFSLSWDKPHTNIKADLVINAIWERIIYTIIFYLDGGTLISGDLEQMVEYEGAAEAPILEKEGYVLVGWSDSFDRITSNMDISPIWQEIIPPMNVVLIPNGGTIENESVDVEYNQLYDFSKPVKENYVFAGWFDEENGAGKKYPFRGVWDLESGTTLYAHWLDIVPVENNTEIPNCPEPDFEEPEELELDDDQVDIIKDFYVALFLAYLPEDQLEYVDDIRTGLLSEFDGDMIDGVLIYFSLFGVTQAQLDNIIALLGDATEWLVTTMGKESQLPEGFENDEEFPLYMLNLLIVPEELAELQELLEGILNEIPAELIGKAVYLMMSMFEDDLYGEDCLRTYEDLLNYIEDYTGVADFDLVLNFLEAQGDIAIKETELDFLTELLAYDNLCYLVELLFENVNVVVGFDSEKLAKLIEFVMIVSTLEEGIEDPFELLELDGPIALKDVIDIVNILGEIILEMEDVSQEYLLNITDLIFSFIPNFIPPADSLEDTLMLELYEGIKETYPLSLVLKFVGNIMKDLEFEDVSEILVTLDDIENAEEEDLADYASIIVRVSKIIWDAYSEFDESEQARIRNLIAHVENGFVNSHYLFASAHLDFNIFSRIENFATYPDPDNLSEQQVEYVMEYIYFLLNMPYVEMYCNNDVEILEIGTTKEEFIQHIDGYIIVEYIDFIYLEEFEEYEVFYEYDFEIQITAENIISFNSSTPGLRTIVIRIDNSQIINQCDLDLPIRTFDVEIEVLFYDSENPFVASGYEQIYRYYFDEYEEVERSRLWYTYVYFEGVRFDLWDADTVTIIGLDTSQIEEDLVAFGIAYFPFGKVAFPIYYDVEEAWAWWEHRITFHANDGSGSTYIRYYDDFSLWITESDYDETNEWDLIYEFYDTYQAGYIISAWAWDADGYDLIDFPVEIQGDVHIYLIWSPVYEIRLYYNNDQYEEDEYCSWPEYYYYILLPIEGNKIDLQSLYVECFEYYVYVPDGYEFVGWAYGPDEDVIEAYSIIMPGEDLYLYAIWEIE